MILDPPFPEGEIFSFHRSENKPPNSTYLSRPLFVLVGLVLAVEEPVGEELADEPPGVALRDEVGLDLAGQGVLLQAEHVVVDELLEVGHVLQGLLHVDGDGGLVVRTVATHGGEEVDEEVLGGADDVVGSEGSGLAGRET